MKILLISVDGMRPDALSGVAAAQEILKRSVHTLDARTVIPSVTLPCHMSLMHSVDPARHGITTNLYMPQVRPIKGLCEVLSAAKKTCAFFHNWEELRDLSRPASLAVSFCCKGAIYGRDKANAMVANTAISHLTANDTDFAFVYFGYPDAAGHEHGWMSPQYMAALENSWENISKIVNALDDDYCVIITADHGGHDRTHGTELPEDMIIPVIVLGKRAEEFDLSNASIKDIAPTITELLGVAADEEWEGKSLLR